jgi:hypothetical protein
MIPFWKQKKSYTNTLATIMCTLTGRLPLTPSLLPKKTWPLHLLPSNSFRRMQSSSPAKSTVLVTRLKIAQLAALEAELMDSVAELKTCKHIFGTAPTLEELLNPIQECEVGDLPY